MATVTVEKLRLQAGVDYATDCAALTGDYGSPDWDARPEVAAIRTAGGHLDTISIIFSLRKDKKMSLEPRRGAMGFRPERAFAGRAPAAMPLPSHR